MMSSIRLAQTATATRSVYKPFAGAFPHAFGLGGFFDNQRQSRRDRSRTVLASSPIRSGILPDTGTAQRLTEKVTTLVFKKTKRLNTK